MKVVRARIAVVFVKLKISLSELAYVFEITKHFLFVILFTFFLDPIAITRHTSITGYLLNYFNVNFLSSATFSRIQY